MANLLTLGTFIDKVKDDEEVSFVIAFKKGAVEEAYYAPGKNCSIKNKLGSPIKKEDINDLCKESYFDLKAMTMLSGWGSPGRILVHLPSCVPIIVTY
jgi:hypothetical protein